MVLNYLNKSGAKFIFYFKIQAFTLNAYTHLTNYISKTETKKFHFDTISQNGKLYYTNN